MRAEVYLHVQSSEAAIKFYVDELALFEVFTDYGMNDFLLRAVRNPNFCLQISERSNKHGGTLSFGLAVDNCDAELERLKRLSFSGGARIVPDADGGITVFDWPGGKSFSLEDPSKNQFLLFEDYIAGHDSSIQLKSSGRDEA